MQNLTNIFETKTEKDTYNLTTDIIWNFNSSETRRGQNFDTETFKWTSAEISRLIQIIVRPVLLIVGSVGNGLTFYIMRRTSLKNVSSCFYMAVLALADTRKYEFNLPLNVCPL